MLPTYSIESLQKLNPMAYYRSSIISKYERDGCKQAAEVIGMQTGLAHESKVINKRLEHHAQQLNDVFNFNLLMYHHYLLPPVIVESDNQVRVSGDGTLISAGGKSYRIIKQVQFGLHYLRGRLFANDL